MDDAGNDEPSWEWSATHISQQNISKLQPSLYMTYTETTLTVALIDIIEAKWVSSDSWLLENSQFYMIVGNERFHLQHISRTYNGTTLTAVQIEFFAAIWVSSDSESSCQFYLIVCIGFFMWFWWTSSIFLRTTQKLLQRAEPSWE